MDGTLTNHVIRLEMGLAWMGGMGRSQGDDGMVEGEKQAREPKPWYNNNKNISLEKKMSHNIHIM